MSQVVVVRRVESSEFRSVCRWALSSTVPITQVFNASKHAFSVVRGHVVRLGVLMVTTVLNSGLNYVELYYSVSTVKLHTADCTLGRCRKSSPAGYIAFWRIIESLNGV